MAHVVQGSLLELLGDVLHTGAHGVIGLADGAGSVRLGGLGADDAGWGQATALGDLGGGPLGAGRGGLGHIEDVEHAAGGGLLGGGHRGVVRDVVAVNDVVVPVAAAGLEGGGAEAESSLPFAGGGSLGQGELSGVVVP